MNSILDEIRKHGSLYSIKIEDEDVVFTAIDQQDLEAYLQISESLPRLATKLEKELVAKYILDPIYTVNDLKSKPYGFTDSLFRALFFVSKPESIEDVELEIKEAKLILKDNIFDQANLFIVSAFPGIDFNSLKLKKWAEIVNLLALAEIRLNTSFLEKPKKSKKSVIIDTEKVPEKLDPREVFLQTHETSQ